MHTHTPYNIYTTPYIYTYRCMQEHFPTQTKIKNVRKNQAAKVLRSEGSRNFLWGLELAMHWLKVDQQLTNSLCKILRGLFRTGIQLSGERAKSGLLNVNQGLSKGCQSWTETRSVLELPTPSLPTPFGGSGILFGFRFRNGKANSHLLS